MCGEFYEDDPPHLLKRHIAERDLKIKALEAMVQNREVTIVQLIRTAEEHRRDTLEALDHAASLQLDLDSEEKEVEENQYLSIALQDAEDTISDLRDEIEAFEKEAAKPKKKAKKGGRK